MENLTNLAGRQWISSQEDFITSAGLTKVSAIVNKHCQRCGARVSATLPNGKFYCRACIGIGRVVEGDLLVRNGVSRTFPHWQNGGLTWRGQLTNQQAEISHKLVTNFQKGQNTLVHAVTGAGKTEMMFYQVAKCLAKGGRCCIASPRIDVVNELFPRFKAAFTDLTIGKYHGRDFNEPGLEQLTICTTHQLLKFFRAFDLLIIDEVDAFPYVADPQLHFGARHAVKKPGVCTYLTATPTRALLEQVKTGELKLVRLQRRFHGGLLPVPRERLFLRPYLAKGKIHPQLLKEIRLAVKQGHPLLLFVPRIEQIPRYLAALKQVSALSGLGIAGVHASDPHRLEKVDQFRRGELQLLVTTTILERGVTFKHVWVIVVQADDQIYPAASLVQIAGRVGRAKDDSAGLVLFCYHKYTGNIRQAMQQIRRMNQ
ncbi:helicase-related protein [Lactobacillus xylocopicola]|uniref:DNA/RNA helicase n=1 Tax=Lactobacillus xylocopicola TaxID=2976676 RepID=A0ABN6SMD5_9LACO|nr:helicase-related protein [Lactobacillus xylocopicola]BDR60241.1 DNA/RNA helicase [Lactobacillus xylocopicola]